jgi:REP element-mobilizing transposase RayT
MARPLRINYPGAFYHVTSRGNELKKIFKANRDREKFLEYLETATHRYDAVIHVFCLLDNHYHLLLETPSGNMPQIMRHINGAYTTYFNLKHTRSGHLFQGRYKAILVEMDEYAKVLSRYIHLNPVRANMATTPEEYPWSSYQHYIGKQKPPEWLHRDFILGYFGGNLSAAQKRYHAFVTSLIDEKYDSPLDEVVSSALLGSPDFVAYVKDTFLSDKEPDKDLPALKGLVEKASMQDIFDEVDVMLPNQRVLARNVKLYLCQRYSGEKLKNVGMHFGIGESAVCHASRRVDERMSEDKKLKRIIEKIEKKLNLSRFKT